MDKILGLLRSPIFWILGLTLIVYSNIFTNQFIGDDLDFIVNWPNVRSLSNVPKLIAGEVPSQHVGTYRPIRNILFLISYQLFGTNPFGYHLVSLATHLISTFLIYLICLKLTKHKPLSQISSLIFGLHPIHTEAITFITASYDSVGILLSLISFYCYLLSQSRPIGSIPGLNQLHQSKSRDFATSKQTQLITFCLSLITSVLAFFTNETALVMPILIGLHHYLFVSSGNVKKTYIYTRNYIILAVVYVVIRTQLVYITTRGTYQANSFYLTMLTSLKAALEYFKTYLWPVDLSVSHILPGNISTYTFQKYNLAAIKSQHLLEPSIITAIVILILLSLIAYCYRKSQPVITFSIAWMLISLLPVLNIVPTALIFSERYSYLSSVGFCLLFGYVLIKISGFFSSKPSYKSIKSSLFILYTLYSILALISVTYAYLTYTRNHVWRDEITFWQKEILLHPSQSMAYFQLAKVSQVRHLIPEAIANYQKAIELTPDFPESYHQLGVIYQYQGNFQLAAKNYQNALQYSPEFQPAWNNLHYLCSTKKIECNY